MHPTLRCTARRALLTFVVTTASACATTSSTCPAPAAQAAPASAAGEPPLEIPLPAGQQQHAVRASETQWGPCQPSLPQPCEMVVIEGDPRARTLFTVRFRVPAGFEMPPHTHPRAERVTIISGKVGVSFDPADRSKGKVFTVGDHYINAPDAVHIVWTEEESVIQIHGIGPWVATAIATPAQ